MRSLNQKSDTDSERRQMLDQIHNFNERCARDTEPAHPSPFEYQNASDVARPHFSSNQPRIDNRSLSPIRRSNIYSRGFPSGRTMDTGFASNRANKFRKPEPFDGKSMSWSDYLTHFELIAKWNNWSHDEKAMQMAMSLTGEALAELSNLPQSVVTDFDTLTMSLANRFEPRERIMSARCEFRRRKQKKGETPTDFAFSLRRLMSRAYPQLDNQAKEIFLIEQFIAGLNSLELQKHVQLSHPLTLSIAVSAAEEIEAFYTSSFVKGTKPVNSVQEISDEEEICVVNSNFHKQYSSHKQNFQNRNQPYTRPNADKLTSDIDRTLQTFLSKFTEVTSKCMEQMTQCSTKMVEQMNDCSSKMQDSANKITDALNKMQSSQSKPYFHKSSQNSEKRNNWNQRKFGHNQNNGKSSTNHSVHAVQDCEPVVQMEQEN